MAFRNRRSALADRIAPSALATFGRYEFLGSELSGVEYGDAYSLVSDLVSACYPPDGPGSTSVITELRRHSAHGEWEKVGTWKFVRNFLTESPDTADIIDAGLLAVHRMRITNLAIHLAPIDTPRYEELTGAAPRNEMFFGPPVFESAFGPTRQDYFDHAIAAAARRSITRLDSVPGVEPGAVDAAAHCLWDFAMLIYRGPLVVNPDNAFEPNVVRPAAAAATGVDHGMFAEQLVAAALEPSSAAYGAWTSIGAARFIEDYLEREVAESAAWERAADSGLAQLVQMDAIGTVVALDLFTPRQRARLAMYQS